MKKQAEDPHGKAGLKPPAESRMARPGPLKEPDGSALAGSGQGKPPQGKTPAERRGPAGPRGDKPGHGRPQPNRPGKPIREKVPFNNPFLEVFGKK